VKAKAYYAPLPSFLTPSATHFTGKVRYVISFIMQSRFSLYEMVCRPVATGLDIVKYKELICQMLTLLPPHACRLLNTLTLLPLGVYVSE
jgi:hypothetical protein